MSRWRAYAPWIFVLPVLAGVIGRVHRHGWWLNDFDAVICAAWRNAQHLPLYAQHLACPGARPAAYVYVPQIAWALTPLARLWSVTELRAGYGLVYAAILGFVLWDMLGPAMAEAPRGLRLAVFTLLSGSAVACGNLAWGCHALVLGAGQRGRGRALPLIVAIVTVSLIKPVFLTYLLILAYQDAPWRTRAVRLGAALGLAGLVAALVAATGGTGLEAWRDSLRGVVVDWQTGVGFLDDMARFGLRADQPLTQGLYIVFAGAVSLAGLAIAERRELSQEGRFYLAVALAQLTNPRLMDYDLALLMAGAAVVAASAGPAWRPGLMRALMALGVLAFLLNLAELTRVGIRLGPALLTGIVLVAGWAAWTEGARAARLAPA